MLINFYHHGERLVAVGGHFSEAFVEEYGGRREVFDLADDEQLIGCELTDDGDFYVGVKWIKIRLY